MKTGYYESRLLSDFVCSQFIKFGIFKSVRFCAITQKLLKTWEKLKR